MKRSSLLSLVIIAGLLTSCSGAATDDNNNAPQNETSEITTTTTAEETTTEATTEASTEETTTEATTEETTTEPTAAEAFTEPLQLSLEEVAAIVKDAYGEGLDDFTESSEYENDTNQSNGIVQVVNSMAACDMSSNEENWMLSCTILEFDMDSELYQELEVGQRINVSYMEEYDAYMTASAINHQYVLCVSENYIGADGNFVSNGESPFRFEGLGSAINAFNAIAD